MGVLVHPNFSDEAANGVAVTDDILYQTKGNYYLNTQVGEDLVTNPEANSIPKELLLNWWKPNERKVMRQSSLAKGDGLLMSDKHLTQMNECLGKIHARFAKLYGKSLERDGDRVREGGHPLHQAGAANYVSIHEPSPGSRVCAQEREREERREGERRERAERDSDRERPRGGERSERGSRGERSRRPQAGGFGGSGGRGGFPGRPAGRPGGAGGGFGGPPGGPGGPGGFMRMFPIMAALDADGNGEISAEEIKAAPAALKKLDKNKDGKLTDAELLPSFPGFGGSRGGSVRGGGSRGGFGGRGGGPQGRPSFEGDDRPQSPRGGTERRERGERGQRGGERSEREGERRRRPSRPRE